MLSGAAMIGTVPESVQRALAISPDPGTSFLDAEHIVILMQENRSFDHCYGSLRGVRGFNDPRVHTKPDGNPVWLQTTKDGITYAPFRLNMKQTNITWLGGLPHGWWDQVEARNHGAYDRWLEAKPAGYQPLADKPMTLGHYTREDIPFYYALADAFTVCDQHFCSCLTGTTPNRLYLWTGTIRPEPRADSKPHVYNEETDHDHEGSWPTFPEQLEEAGISWKVYQNEIDMSTGLTGEEDSWLGNFNDNPLEFMTQYRVRFAPRRRAFVADRIPKLKKELASLQADGKAAGDEKKLKSLQAELAAFEAEAEIYTEAAWQALSEKERALHQKALITNEGDPNFRNLDSLEYEAAGERHHGKVPKGDTFDQFRKDVQSGNLPTVSWLVGSEHFSDHPASAWFGAWYVSETLDILTQNPEVWKKTIFILTYDENDGYFDHVPPFVAPNPNDYSTGAVSSGIDAGVEYVTKAQDLAFRPDYPPQESSLGLGYRVPMVIESPWSRGGVVCSQVFDHTSVIQFLETFLSHKTGKTVNEPNITAWRRAVCGDLTSSFQTADFDQGKNPAFLDRDTHLKEIYGERFKQPPSEFKELSAPEIAQIKSSPKQSTLMPHQEPGTRVSCPLPYELYADEVVGDDKTLKIRFHAGSKRKREKLHGASFNVYAYFGEGGLQARAYGVEAGAVVFGSWSLADFKGGHYHVRVDGPNGFMREFKGSPEGKVTCTVGYRVGQLDSRLEIKVHNGEMQPVTVRVVDNSYGDAETTATIASGAEKSVSVSTRAGAGWYDLTLTVDGAPQYERRFAGRIETGRWGTSDPAMA